MNWEALGAIAELIGAVGVIASLIYLGFQVRQSTRSMRAATYDSLVRSNGEWLAPLIQDAGLAASFEVAVTSWADVQEVQRPRVMYLLTQLFRHWENAFFQQQQGTLAPSLWLTWEEIILSYFHQPGIQEWWKLRRTAYTTEFRTFLEASGVGGSYHSPDLRTLILVVPKGSSRDFGGFSLTNDCCCRVEHQARALRLQSPH